jgi:CelD/BcsL family acetyltransferase involved in cellulose biosynthesis
MQVTTDCDISRSLPPGRVSERPRSATVQTMQNHRLDGDLWIEVATSTADFAGRESLWDDLSENASEPNAFHERWFLEAALNSFGKNRDLVIAFVYRRSRRQDFPPALVGLFPFERTRPAGTIARRLTLFDHSYSFLLSPLIRQGHEVDVWRTVLDWSVADRRCDMLDLPLIRGEGPAAQSLVEVLHERGTLAMVSDSHARAFLRRADSAQDYLEDALTSKQRHEYARQSRRLAEGGLLEFRLLNDPSQRQQWMSQFLQLESQGWKGDSRTALVQTELSRQFFETITLSAASRGRLQALGLFLNDRPIAMKINFLCAPGSFAFKIAYDESLSKYSPGVQLELESLRRLHDAPAIQWMDSCAAPGHPMINRLWRQRSIIQQVLISTGTVRGNLGVGLRPLVRAGRRLFGGKSAASKAALSNSSQEKS